MNYQPEFFNDVDDTLKKIQENLRGEFLGRLIFNCCRKYSEACELLEIENDFKEKIKNKWDYNYLNYSRFYEYICAYFRFDKNHFNINMFSQTSYYEETLREEFIQFLDKVYRDLYNDIKIVKLIVKIYCSENINIKFYTFLYDHCYFAEGQFLYEIVKKYHNFPAIGNFRFTKYVKSNLPQIKIELENEY